MAKVTKLTFKLDDDGHHSARFGMPEFRPKMVVVDCADQPLAFDLFEELPAVEELVVMRASTFMFRMMPETLKKLQIVDPMWDLQIILESGMEEDALRQHLAQGPLATAEIFFWFQPGTRMPTVEHDFWTSLQNVKLYAKT